MLTSFVKAPFFCRKIKSNQQIVSGISGLDHLHEMTKSSIEVSNKDMSAPSGCFNERLNYDHPKELIHEEMSHHHLMQGPFQLQVYLEKSKQEYLSFIHQMRVIF